MHSVCTIQAFYQNYIFATLQTSISLNDIPELFFSIFVNVMHAVVILMTPIIEELETNGKIKNIRDLYRGINDFKKGYQPGCNIVKDEKGDLVADSNSIVDRWRTMRF